jgi:hypothetical protein
MAQHEVDEIGDDHGEWQHFTREVDLLEQIMVGKHGLAGVHQRHLEEHPGQEGHEEIRGVVGYIDPHNELHDDRDGGHLDERVDERPEKAEDRVLVAHLEVTYDQLREKVAVFEELEQVSNHNVASQPDRGIW